MNGALRKLAKVSALSNFVFLQCYIQWQWQVTGNMVFIAV